MIRLAVNVRKLIPGKIGGQEQAFRDVFDVLVRKHRDELEVTLLTSFLSERSFGGWEGLVRLRSVPGASFRRDGTGACQPPSPPSAALGRR